jgi:hypothetical protein
MNRRTNHVFTGKEVAMAYALSAERIAGNDENFLNKNQAVIPIFVSQLFQSIEIAIKYASIESGLFTEEEARSRENRSGHGIRELAKLACERLGGEPFGPIMMAMTRFNKIENSGEIIRHMISGAKFEKTRECYASRCLVYGQVADGDFALVDGIPEWIASVKETASNLPKIIKILRDWKASPSKSPHFVIGLQKY